MSEIFLNPKENLTACRSVIAILREYKAKNRAIGLSYSRCQPDGFSKFLALRDLPSSYYVAGGARTYGNPGAYNNMINTLNDYKNSLWSPSA